MEGFYLMPHPPIMIPEVGCGEEKKIQNTIDACNKISEDIKNKGVETIILISPHGTVFRDAIGIIVEEKISGSLKKFGVPQISMTLDIDMKLTQSIISKATEEGISIAPLNTQVAPIYGINLELDHGAIVPLYHIISKGEYNLVHITYGMLSPMELYKFGMCISKSVEESNRKCAIIASGDLSHRLKNEGPYDYSPYGEQFDESLLNILQEGNIEKLLNLGGQLVSEAGECGLKSIYIMAGSMDDLKIKGNLLSYEGTFGVGYGVMSFDFTKGNSTHIKIVNNREEESKRRIREGNPYTKLARRNLDTYFKTGSPIDVRNDIESELINDRKGVFVSLKENGQLRGCIGTIGPVTNSIAEEIIRNSISAATEDPRFPKVKREELPFIDISVDVLYEPEPCEKNDLDPKNYGVIVTSGRRRGLLLPNLEGVNTIEEQLSIALQKGDIYESENYTIERFKVERFKEVDGDD